MVEITSRPLRIINLSGKNRIYNKETTVEIIGGEFDKLSRRRRCSSNNT